MNNTKRLDSGQSLLSAPSPIASKVEVKDINLSPLSHNGNTILTSSERERKEAEALKQEIISLSRQFFATLGEKLKYVRDRKLYRFEAKTFGQWCEEQLGMKRFYAHRLIRASEVYENVAHGQQIIPENLLPTNERQVRPLTKLPPDQQVALWVKAVEEGDKMPTGKQIERLVKEKERMEREVRYQTHTERFKVGDVVRITAKYNSELKDYHHCWAQIVSVEEFSYTVLTWKGNVDNVAHGDLMLMRVPDKDSAGSWLSQLNKIREQKSKDSDCTAFLHYLGTKPDPSVSEWANLVLDLTLG